jgi:hypothetical protein
VTNAASTAPITPEGVECDDLEGVYETPGRSGTPGVPGGH